MPAEFRRAHSGVSLSGHSNDQFLDMSVETVLLGKGKLRSHHHPV